MDTSCYDILRNDIVSGIIIFVGFLRQRKIQNISGRNSTVQFPALNRGVYSTRHYHVITCASLVGKCVITHDHKSRKEYSVFLFAMLHNGISRCFFDDSDATPHRKYFFLPGNVQRASRLNLTALLSQIIYYGIIFDI